MSASTLPRITPAPAAPKAAVAVPASEQSASDAEAASTAPTVRRGNGQLINTRVAAQPAPQQFGGGEASFNFEGQPLPVVVKIILGDLLKQNYIIAPGVQGTVTISTPRPVSHLQALALLETVLGWNNARLIWADGRYNVVLADTPLSGTLTPRVAGLENMRGYELRAVPLKYIAATEMEKLLKPYARSQAVVQLDSARNLLVLGGTRAELQNYLRTIEIFDVDWLAGMSVGVYPLQSAQAESVVAELEKVFGEGGKTPVAGMFRFMPLSGQNAIMVFTPQASYLSAIEQWIERFDAGGDGARLYVYDVQNIRASDLAAQLSQVYGGNSATPPERTPVMPGLDPVEVRTTDTPSQASLPAPQTRSGVSARLQVAGTEVGVTAVADSNALLVRANPAQWQTIRRAIEKLDLMPLQVHIEAQVVEVKLSGELRYGVSWYFGNQVPAASLPQSQTTNNWRNTGTAITPTGNNFTFVGPSAQAVLSTLDSISDLRVLSAPSVLVRNNAEANFSSGTQIPVASTILNQNGNSNIDNTYSQVQFRQTGVSLKVRPRVSSSGMVFLDIVQDVSSPSLSGPEIGGNVSVDNRRLQTEVAVRSGDTIILAGLIKTEQGKGSSGIPFLSRIPILGALFGQQNNLDNREEVLVLITPSIVRDASDLRKTSDEYGERFKALEPMRF
jgi:general secretion pathway protein D